MAVKNSSITNLKPFPMKTVKSLLVAMMLIPATVLLMNNCTKDNETMAATDEASVEKVLYAEDSLILQQKCDSLPYEDLNPEEVNALILMREEELLAHDVYTGLSAVYQIPVFTFISRSELQHATAIQRLLQKYELPDPAENHVAGVFTSNELQTLYTSLMEQGSASLIAALTVGATIEDLDIKDLMDLSEVADNQDILWVFANLTKGSRNHLRSFSKLLTRNGVSYAPQLISEELYLQIVNSPHERGPVRP